MIVMSVKVVFLMSGTELVSSCDRANRAFRQTRVRLTLESLVPSGAVPERVDSRAIRDRLQRGVMDGLVNVFVTGELRDLEDPERRRFGVHWHRTGHRGERGEHYIILARYSRGYVLAHELGHFFGNPRHSDIPGNLMSYDHRQGVPTLTRAQRRRIDAAAERYTSSGELRPTEGSAVR